MHLARIVFLQMRGTPILERKLQSDTIYPVHLLDDEVFHLVVGNDELRLHGEALEDRGHDGRFNKTPGSSRFSPDNSVPIGVIGSANFVDEV